MDKSREQFLEWFSKEYEEVNNSTELSAQVIKMIASAAWQASRAAVEIEIPEVLDYWLGREGFAESIRAAGLKVKGE
ncbi:hypothetical protein [Cronobacter malonaticus]|uniref:hypothetical protein n=1 Tax=Cronobacter malonaticus TaxID=413503 RepID=UPI000CFC6E75|nr:hypothetical protein [Cronobacter malonaticus]EGT4280897.1 hypothetical protein [Cronobacter malonaticus]EGT4298773.1 hypothetical protein [Cronobacter malonaticus]